jgi:protein arginine kinase activator
MAIKCDQCDRDATVHEVSMRNGVRIERHLCEQCAVDVGISIQPTSPVTEIIKQVMLKDVASKAATPRGPAQIAACPACKMTFGEFKQGGLLGCAMCYATFEAQLGPLIERAHEGGTAHTGKKPKRAATGVRAGPTAQQEDLHARRQQRLRDLRKELEQAVASERYEQAAKLRDELRQLGE